MQDFKHGAVWPVLVASYESLRAVAADLAGACDLLVCDEGHRCEGLGAPKGTSARASGSRRGFFHRA